MKPRECPSAAVLPCCSPGIQTDTALDVTHKWAELFKKLLHSYRVNIENPEINLGEFSEEPPLFILKYFAS